MTAIAIDGALLEAMIEGVGSELADPGPELDEALERLALVGRVVVLDDGRIGLVGPPGVELVPWIGGHPSERRDARMARLREAFARLHDQDGVEWLIGANEGWLEAARAAGIRTAWVGPKPSASHPIPHADVYASDLVGLATLILTEATFSGTESGAARPSPAPVAGRPGR